MKRLFAYALVILMCFLLQTTFLHFIALAGVVPNLLLIVTVSIGYMRGRKEAMGAGFACGLLIDMMYGSVVGVNALFFLVIGYLNGLCNKFYFHEDFTIPFFLIGASDFLYNFMFYIIEFLLRNRLSFFTYMRICILPEVIYTVIVSFVLYKLLHSLNHFLLHFEREEG